MELTQEQKEEIKAYIIDVPRYRETYNELYDHILNSLKDNPGTYDINEVVFIINNEFGGFQAIVEEEKLYQKQLSKRYNRLFLLEMLNTFKWPEIINNLSLVVLCLILYNYNKNISANLKPTLLSSVICFAIIAVFGFAKILLNRRKYSKYSILDNYMGFECTFGVAMVNIFMQLFIGKNNLFNLSESGKSIAILGLFFFCSVYVRAFIKFYNQKFKVLTA